MKSKIKIALAIPDSAKPDRYFSLRLKESMSNENSEYNQPRKICVLSNIEGNFRSFCKLLIKYRVVDKRMEWIFGDKHLVILGDCFDRGDQVMECLWLIYSLEEKSKKQNGHVHYILGNLEILNLIGDFRYLHPNYSLSTRPRYPHTALYDGNNELWRWLQTKNIMEKVGETLFVHGGISTELLQLRLSIKDINERVRRQYLQNNELFTDPLLEIVYNKETSPFSFQGYYQGRVAEEEVESILTHFGVKTIVTGHVIMNQTNSYFNGKVININADYGANNSEGLVIRRHRFYRITVDGKRERIK